MQFIQCDDLVEPAVADEIERLMVSGGFPWYFYSNVNSTVRPEDRATHTTVIFDDSRYEESFGFSTLLFPTEEPNSPLFRYAMRAVPPIHIIVRNGRVALKGIVATQQESQIANIKARSVSGVFEVKNELQVESNASH